MARKGRPKTILNIDKLFIVKSFLNGFRRTKSSGRSLFSSDEYIWRQRGEIITESKPRQIMIVVATTFFATAFSFLFGADSLKSLTVATVWGLVLGVAIILSARSKSMALLSLVTIGFGILLPLFSTWTYQGEHYLPIMLYNVILYSIASTIAWKYSNEKAWRTAVIIVFWIGFVSIFSLFLGDSISLTKTLLLSLLAVSSVLLWRCGGSQMFYEWKITRASWDARKNIPCSRSSIRKPAIETARLLATLGDEFTILHDYNVRESTALVPHVVSGPSGLFIIDEVYAPGKIVSTLDEGIIVEKTPEIFLVAGTLNKQKKAIARAAGAPPSSIRTVIVLHGQSQIHQTVSLFLPRVEEEIGRIVLVSPDQFYQEISPGFSIWEEKLQERISKSLIENKLTVNEKTIFKQDHISDLVRFSEIDFFGKAEKPKNMPNPEPSKDWDWIMVGKKINIITNVGTLFNYRITHYPSYNKGEWVIGACMETEWKKALSENREPVWQTYPVENIVSPAGLAPPGQPTKPFWQRYATLPISKLRGR